MAVGIVGLGNMGSAMSARLLATGPVVGFDLDPARRAAAEQLGVRVADTVEDLVRQSAAVILSLPRPSVSRSVLEQVLAIDSSALVIETSTISPEQADEMERRATSVGAEYVGAAVLSGVGEVATGASCWLVGGHTESVADALAILERVCSRRITFESAKAAMAAKVINNAVAHAVYVVLAEAAALGTAEGISHEVLCQLLAQEDAGVKRPLTGRLAGRYAERNFDGGMPTEAARKDSALALEMARADRVPLFAIAGSDVVYELALVAGMGRNDYAAVATLWERWAEEGGTR